MEMENHYCIINENAIITMCIHVCGRFCLAFRDHLHLHIFVGQTSPSFSSTICLQSCQLSVHIFHIFPVVMGVRDGGAGGAAAPPIRAVCRHEFGQRVDIIRAKHNTCLKNTNLGYVTAVNGKKPTHLGSVTGVNGNNPVTPHNMEPGKFLLLPPPPPTEYGSRKISATTPPPTESIRAKLGLPPQMDVGPYAYAGSCLPLPILLFPGTTMFIIFRDILFSWCARTNLIISV